MIRTGDVIYNSITGESIRFVETAADTDGERVVIEVLVEPNGFVAARSHAPVPDRGVRGGRGRAHLQGRRRDDHRGRGESVTVEPGTAHKFWNASETAARFRCDDHARRSSSRS